MFSQTVSTDLTSKTKQIILKLAILTLDHLEREWLNDFIIITFDKIILTTYQLFTSVQPYLMVSYSRWCWLGCHAFHYWANSICWGRLWDAVLFLFPSSRMNFDAQNQLSLRKPYPSGSLTKYHGSEKTPYWKLDQFFLNDRWERHSTTLQLFGPHVYKKKSCNDPISLKWAFLSWICCRMTPAWNQRAPLTASLQIESSSV